MNNLVYVLQKHEYDEQGNFDIQCLAVFSKLELAKKALLLFGIFEKDWITDNEYKNHPFCETKRIKHNGKVISFSIATYGLDEWN